jgi:hypothetical protein
VVKRVRVKLFGHQNRSVVVDSDATQGAVIGKDLRWGDGTLVVPGEIVGGGGGDVELPEVMPTLWELILNIPAIIKSLVALATDGIVHNTAGVITAHYWPCVKNSIETGESFTVLAGNQLLVWDDFVLDGGALTLEGNLVILGGDIPSESMAYISSAMNYTILAWDHTVVATITGLTFTLPTAVGVAGKEYILKLDVVGTLTIDGYASELIDGATTAVLSDQYESISVISDGANWDIV